MSRSASSLLALAIGLLATSFVRAEKPAADAFVRQVQPLIKQHCLSCHGPDAQEGGVSYADLTEDKLALRQRRLWQRALSRIKSGEMPPEGDPPLTAEAKQTLVAWMSFASDYLDCSPEGRDPGPTVVRRLTRTEYDRTIRDLLGVEFKSADAVGMPDEGVFEGFENTSAALGFSPALLEKYLTAADRVLELLFSPRYAKQLQALLGPTPTGDMNDEEIARQIATRIIRRAYRAPATDADVVPLVTIYTKARQRGESYEQAMRALLKPVLVAPKFLYRIEGTSDAATTNKPAGNGTRINDHELAVRVSYFLWSSMPDDALFAAADAGQLNSTEGLREQTLRLLKSPKARAWIDEFAVQWLQLKKLDQARPQREFFPTFTNELKQAMREETLTFLDNLRQEDRSLLELLDADYTFVNGTLATHYNLTPPAGKAFERVALKPEDHRGGLLGMGSVLAMTSHTFRTSPTLRGKYVLETILGVHVPPPPANAGMLKEDQKDKKKAAATFRELLAQHSTQKACAGCHKKLDPLGFALDNYDAIGAWRESQPELPLDVVGELPTGEKFRGTAELKKLLLERKEEFARGLVSKALSYALGRELDYYDDCTIQEICERLKREDYRFSSLILGIVESYPFQHRRLAD